MHNQRKEYGKTLVELGRENPDIVVLEADLGKSTMSCMFEAEFPKRYFEMGIAEQNMTSFAGGLSRPGKFHLRIHLQYLPLEEHMTRSGRALLRQS